MSGVRQLPLELPVIIQPGSDAAVFAASGFGEVLDYRQLGGGVLRGRGHPRFQVDPQAVFPRERRAPSIADLDDRTRCVSNGG